MRVLSLSAENFRNLQNDTISFSDKMNVVFGNNAQGKTNLIEAIWLFSGAKSFRGSRDSEMIRFDADFAALKLTFCDKQRSQTAELRFGRQDKKSFAEQGAAGNSFKAERSILFRGFFSFSSEHHIRRSQKPAPVSG